MKAKTTRAGALLLLLLAAALLGVVRGREARPAEALPYPALGPDLEPLRTQFNQDVGKVRLLLLLDPT